MADYANTRGEVNERDGMVVNWSDLKEEDRIIVAELVAQQQSQEEPEAAAEPLMTMSTMLLFLMRFSMILAASQISRVLLQRRSKHR